MIRVVVDPSVFVSAFIGRPDAAPAQVVRAIRDRRVELVASLGLFDELRGVLDRPKFARWSSDGRADAYVGGLAAMAEMHPDDPAPPAQTRDPQDDYLIALAQTAAADLIVSVDRDLLDVSPTPPSVTPTALIARLAAESSG